MNQCSSRILGVLLVLTLSRSADAQQVTQVFPANLTFRAVSILNDSNAMAVGDSASVLVTDVYHGRWWYLLKSPCSKSHTLRGVSYYRFGNAVVISDSGLIYSTSDKALNWKPSGTGIPVGMTYHPKANLHAITYTKQSGLIIVGDSGLILQSDNEAATWTRIASGTTHDITAISINDNGLGYFVGEHGLIGRTTDYGMTWPVVTDTIHNVCANSDFINFRAVAVDDSVGALAVGDSGGIACCQDGLWTAINAHSSFYYPPNDDSTWKAKLVTHSNYTGVSVLFRTITDSSLRHPEIVFAVAADNDFTLWFYLYWGRSNPTSHGNLVNIPQILGDADGGSDHSPVRAQAVATWKHPDLTSQIVMATPFASMRGDAAYNETLAQDKHTALSIPDDYLHTSFDSNGVGYATCISGVFLVSTNNGRSWDFAFADQGYNASEVLAIDDNTAIAVGEYGMSYQTYTAGSSWDTVRIDGGNERLHGIASPADSIFLVCGDFGTILRSTDDAQNWKPVATTSTSYLQEMAFSSRQIGVAVGSNGTILRTTDQGSTWKEINNILSGTTTSYRSVAAFPSGKYFATTDSSGLFRSIDNGLSWSPDKFVPNSMGVCFYNEKVGVVAESTWSSRLVPDTIRFAFTRDGFSSKPLEFNVPIINDNRVALHFLDSSTFMCYGSFGYIVKVDVSNGSLTVTDASQQTATRRFASPSSLQAYPNPSATHATTVEYDIAESGRTTIELWNAMGEKLQTLFDGADERGHHVRKLSIGERLRGSCFVKVVSGSESHVLPLIME